MKNLVILISGRGSNMEAIVRACASEGWPARIAAVIANRPDAAGLEFAASQGIATKVVDPRQFPDRDSFDAALAQEIDGFAPDLVVLAGFMRVLTAGFVNHYAGRMLNVPPSQLDHGPIVAQAAVPVETGDTPAMLAERVLATEHIIYPRAVRWFVEGRLALDGLRVTLTPPEPQWLFAGHTAGEGA